MKQTKQIKQIQYKFSNLLIVTEKDIIIYASSNIKYWRLNKRFHKPALRKPVHLWKDGIRLHLNNNYSTVKTSALNLIGKTLRQSGLLNKLISIYGKYKVSNY